MNTSISVKQGVMVALGVVLLSNAAYALVDDRQITISSLFDVNNKRQALRRFIWGTNGFPSSRRLPSVTLNVPSPVGGLNNLQRVDRLRTVMDAGQEALAFHFIPRQPNNRLVVLHHGHACDFNDDPGLADVGDGMQRTINGLLSDGYSVLAAFMPHNTPSDCGGTAAHEAMFSNITLPTGSVMKFFLEPVVVCLNYLQTRSSADRFPMYQEFDMVGLSGGGWTTTVYAAIDQTIRFSFPVAGSIPLYLRSGNSVGDVEQTLSSFYQIAGYPDLYVLGSYGLNRKQVQILNRHDDCCFGQDRSQFDPALAGGLTYDQAIRLYESQVRDALYNLGSRGSFRLEIDEAATGHMISWNSVVNTILSELNSGRKYVGAASSTDAFVRGMNGHLWHHGPAGWEDTTCPMVGVAAVLENTVNRFDVFFRDPSNRAMHAFSNGSGWSSDPMGGVVITDLAAVSWSAGRFDVVAFGGDYKLYHWFWTGSSISPFELVNPSARGFGTPAFVTRGPNQLDIFFRGFDRGLHHIGSSGPVPWREDNIGGTILDFPSALALPDGTLRAYVRAPNGGLFEASPVNGGQLQFASISARTGRQLITGSPSASLQGSTVTVQARAPNRSLSTFTFSGSWSFSNSGGTITGSPTSTPGGALVRGLGGGLWLFSRPNWSELGGTFD